jgi:hypothetical protein
VYPLLLLSGDLPAKSNFHKNNDAGENPAGSCDIGYACRALEVYNKKNYEGHF